MRGKVFDAAGRVLLAGAAVILLTALAIPELTGLDDGDEVKALWAPLLSVTVVGMLYAFYLRSRFRKFGKPGEDCGKWAICFVISLVLGLAARSAVDANTEPDWLPGTVFLAIMMIGQFAAQEWHLLELEFKGEAGE